MAGSRCWWVAIERPRARDDVSAIGGRDLLGLPIEAFRYVQADTALIPRGHGHGGARSLHQAGTALVRAAEQVIEKGRLVAARLLQARPEAVTSPAGVFEAAGGRVGLLEVAAAAEAAETLDTYVWNELNLITFPNGVHVAEVEVDPETGHVDCCGIWRWMISGRCSIRC